MVCRLGRAEGSELIAELEPRFLQARCYAFEPTGRAGWSPRFGVGRLAGIRSFRWDDAIGNRRGPLNLLSGVRCAIGNHSAARESAGAFVGNASDQCGS